MLVLMLRAVAILQRRMSGCVGMVMLLSMFTCF